MSNTISETARQLLNEVIAAELEAPYLFVSLEIIRSGDSAQIIFAPTRASSDVCRDCREDRVAELSRRLGDFVASNEEFEGLATADGKHIEVAPDAIGYLWAITEMFSPVALTSLQEDCTFRPRIGAFTVLKGGLRLLVEGKNAPFNSSDPASQWQAAYDVALAHLRRRFFSDCDVRVPKFELAALLKCEGLDQHLGSVIQRLKSEEIVEDETGALREQLACDWKFNGTATARPSPSLGFSDNLIIQDTEPVKSILGRSRLKVHETYLVLDDTPYPLSEKLLELFRALIAAEGQFVAATDFDVRSRELDSLPESLRRTIKRERGKGVCLRPQHEWLS